MPLIDPTAAQSTISHFYHYQSYCAKYFTDMLRDRMLHFSNPDNVNDPWDCKPWFDYRPMDEDPEECGAMIAAYRKMVPDSPERQVYENLLRTDRVFRRRCIEESSLRLGKELAKRRIYCLTPFPADTLMWSHYAEDHKGICLEFANNNPLIGCARPINYKDEYPTWTPQMLGPEMGTNLELILTKAMDWKYEREYRIIATALDGPTKLYDENFVKLPPGALTAVIIGCGNKDHPEITEIVKRHSPDLKIKWALRTPNLFKLRISDDLTS